MVEEFKYALENNNDNNFFFKLYIIQSMLQIQLYTSLVLGSIQLASLLTKLTTK